MFHLNPIRGQHFLLLRGAMGDLVWVSQIFGDRIIFPDIQYYYGVTFSPALYAV